MDKEIIFYILFLIIAILGRLLGGKKNRKQVNQPQQSSGESDEPVKTFEELLEEFTSQKRDRRSRRDIEATDMPASAESRRRKKVAQELIEEEEEQTPFSFESPDKLRSLDELVDIDEVQTRSRLQSPEEEVVKPVQEDSSIRSMLQNPEDARKAIILGEILNRKYH